LKRMLQRLLPSLFASSLPVTSRYVAYPPDGVVTLLAVDAPATGLQGREWTRQHTRRGAARFQAPQKEGPSVNAHSAAVLGHSLLPHHNAVLFVPHPAVSGECLCATVCAASRAADTLRFDLQKKQKQTEEIDFLTSSLLDSLPAGLAVRHMLCGVSLD
jgi:hypothetical protein